MAELGLLLPDWGRSAPAGIGALSTTRAGGISTGPYGDGAGGGGLNLGSHVGDDPTAVSHNRALLRTLLPAEPAWLEQVHGIDVADAGCSVSGTRADASVAVERGAVCAILTADCLPVLLCDGEGRVVGAAHAGWRGLAHGVLDAVVERMRGAGAHDILAWLGPAIGPRQFEVGEDVRDAFCGPDPGAAAAFTPFAGRPGKYLADIYALARRALARAGVTRVTGGGHCTVAEPGRFYSYRRDGVTGRMASMIWIK